MGWTARMEDTVMVKTQLVATLALASGLLGAGAAFAAAPSASAAGNADAQITRRVLARIEQDMPYSASEFRVSTHDGVVTLSGRAETSYAEERAIEDAHGVHGVTEVRDDLTVVS